MEVPEVGLEAQLALEACAAVGADVVGLRLAVGLPVDHTLVHGSSVLGVEDAPASGVTADVIHDPKPLGYRMGARIKGFDAVCTDGRTWASNRRCSVRHLSLVLVRLVCKCVLVIRECSLYLHYLSSVVDGGGEDENVEGGEDLSMGHGGLLVGLCGPELVEGVLELVVLEGGPEGLPEHGPLLWRRVLMFPLVKLPMVVVVGS